MNGDNMKAEEASGNMKNLLILSALTIIIIFSGCVAPYEEPNPDSISFDEGIARITSLLDEHKKSLSQFIELDVLKPNFDSTQMESLVFDMNKLRAEFEGAAVSKDSVALVELVNILNLAIEASLVTDFQDIHFFAKNAEQTYGPYVVCDYLSDYEDYAVAAQYVWQKYKDYYELVEKFIAGYPEFASKIELKSAKPGFEAFDKEVSYIKGIYTTCTIISQAKGLRG